MRGRKWRSAVLLQYMKYLFRFKLFCIFGVPLVYAIEKFFAVFYVFRMSIYLIHQPILFAVLLHRPAGNFLDKPHNVLRIGGCLCHEFVLDLRHAVCGRLDYQLVKIFEINIKRFGCTATFFCKGFDPGAGKTVFSITLKSFFRDFLLSFAVLLFCLHFWYPTL